MALPRFLWVPFELGRPFGAPHEPAFQRRVLGAALALLESTDGPVVLEDFPDDAPTVRAEDDSGEAWACPVFLGGDEEEPASRAQAVVRELDMLAPWHEVYANTRGQGAPLAAGSSLDEIPKLLGDVADGQGVGIDTDFAPHEWIRLACEDLRTWVLEAVQGQPGRPQPEELRDWFWRETAAARLIAAVARALQSQSDPMLRMLAARALVPREYFDELVNEDTPLPSGGLSDEAAD